MLISQHENKKVNIKVWKITAMYLSNRFIKKELHISVRNLLIIFLEKIDRCSQEDFLFDILFYNPKNMFFKLLCPKNYVKITFGGTKYILTKKIVNLIL